LVKEVKWRKKESSRASSRHQ